MTLKRPVGRFFPLCTVISLIMSLPLDPEECALDPRGSGIRRGTGTSCVSKHGIAAMEEMQEIHALRRTSYGR